MSLQFWAHCVLKPYIITAAWHAHHGWPRCGWKSKSGLVTFTQHVCFTWMAYNNTLISHFPLRYHRPIQRLCESPSPQSRVNHLWSLHWCCLLKDKMQVTTTWIPRELNVGINTVSCQLPKTAGKFVKMTRLTLENNTNCFFFKWSLKC